MKNLIKSKNWLLTLFTIFSITPFGYSQVNTPSSPAIPFGAKIAFTANPYGNGILPTNLPTGAYTPASNLYGKSQDAYNAYNSWKTSYVRACGTQYRVLFDDNSSTVSEGIGYGMLLAAYAADKALFDGLWAYYKSSSNGKGVMNWKMSNCTSASGNNGATDAELDAAMALLVAAKQWPSATSPYTYSTEATTLITAIKDWEIHPSSYQAINGDGWGFGSNCRNPSYQSPAYYRLFATHVPSQASTWNSAVDASYTLLNANRNATTGLVSNWSDQYGTPNTCNGANEYGYDACRNPWRMATEVLWNGNSTAQTNFCVPIAKYINGKGAANAKGPVPQSGGTGGYANATFVSTYAAGICGSNSTYQSIMNSMYTQTKNTVDGSGYFGNTLRVISLFVQTGNFWDPSSTIPLDIKDLTQVSTSETNIKVYPIPCSDKITIELNEATSTDVTYTLIDVLGNTVYTNTVMYSDSPIELNIPTKPGMYQLSVIWNDHKVIRKLIKQ